MGGIDLCHSRRDDEHHHGDPQPQTMAGDYGRTPPWHDIQLAIQGPAVGDVEATFRERWEDPTPLSRNPVHRLHDVVHHDDTHPDPLPPQLPDPPGSGPFHVQVLHTTFSGTQFVREFAVMPTVDFEYIDNGVIYKAYRRLEENQTCALTSPMTSVSAASGGVV